MTRRTSDRKNIFSLVVAGIVVIVVVVIALIAYGIKTNDEWLITAGLFTLFPVPLAGMAMYLNKGFVLGFAGLTVKISSEKLIEQAKERAESSGKSAEEIQNIVDKTIERYPHGITIVYSPKGDMRIEGGDTGTPVEVPDVGAAFVLDPIVGEPPVPQQTIYLNGDEVPESGIYSVVDKSGNYLGHENTYVKGKYFGPFPVKDPRGAGYVLRRKTIVYKPGPKYKPLQPVEISGIYDVVDKKGRWIFHQEACSAGDLFPPMRHEAGDAYVLREAVIHKPV